MSTVTVTTTSDVVNANDGVTSLREAIAEAAAGDTIAFAASLDNQTISLAQSLVLNRDVIIDGDRNNDGLADITLNGQSNGHAVPIVSIAGAATHVLIDGVIFTGGGSTAATTVRGTDGANASGTAQDGRSIPEFGTPYAEGESAGDRYEDNGDGKAGGAGQAAPAAGDGEGFGATAGAIVNEGFLTLRNVAFVGNAAVGGNGGDGGDATTGSVGGHGGNGGVGNDAVISTVTIDLGLLGSYDIDVADLFNAADGGAGGAGGAGARGGNGGDGGSAAGAVVNFGDLTLANVSFRNNSASGGFGGFGGDGTAGGNGGNGGEGGGTGDNATNGGDGGVGGAGGAGGAGGRGGNSGAAAGAILNYGTLNGSGSAVSIGNTANGNNIGTGGNGAAGGSGGAGGRFGNGWVDGSSGDDGAAGATGAHGATGQVGAADAFLVNAGGGTSFIDGSASTIVYLAIDHEAQYEGDSGNGAVFHVYVNRAGDISHSASVEVSFGFSFRNPEFGYPVSTNQYDFAGGVFPSGAGLLTFAANEQQKVITITVAGDTQVEGDEKFTVSLGGWSGMEAGSTIEVTGTILNDDTGLPPSTGDAPIVTDYQGDSAIFTENGPPVFIDVSRNSQVRDTDSPYLNGGRLTITISSNYVAGQDVLSFVTEANGVSLQDDYLYYGAAQIGRVTNTGATLTVEFTADATPELASQILRSVTYNNLSDTPTTAQRTITVTATDADGNTSVARTGTVSVVAVDDGPIIDLDVDNSSGSTGTGYKTSYAPGSAGITLLDTDVTVTDPDGSTFEPYAIVSIASPKAGDLLSVVGTLPAGISVLTGPGFTDSTTVWLTGTGTYAQYIEALRHIQYSNTLSNPDRTTRDIRISLGGENSHATVVVGVPPGTPGDNNGAANSVIEGAAAGAAVGITAFASDSDGNTITYSFDNDAGGRFAINASTGVVTVSAAGASTIDYETAPGHAYGITVRASDGTGFSTTKDFSIAVTNFTPPTPTDSNGAAGGSVTEGAANGTTVGITASSSERGGDGVSYSIVGGDGLFAIDAVTGVVTLANAALIDYESATSHTIAVRASDAGGAHGADQSFTIAVNNAAPSAPAGIEGAAGGSISENAALYDPVGIQAGGSTDPNGGAVTYSLANNAGGRFGITSLGHVIVVNPDLIDYESSGGSYTIVVRAKDAAGLFTDKSFTIAVTDVGPSTPADTDGATGAVVNEGLSNGAAVGITAQASDPHGGAVTYSLTDSAGGLFAISAGTGVVTVASGQTLNNDGATPHDYNITVLASAGSLSASQSFTVTVNNVAPSAPTDNDATMDAVLEGAANGTAVGLTLTASDPGGASLTWSLTDDAGGRFAIDPTTGVVTVADGSLIDFETQDGPYQITAQASDGTLTSSAQSFSIAVFNVASSIPADTDGVTGGTISEDTTDGAAVGITAASIDPNGAQITYSLVDHAGGRFAIDATSGVVTVADASLIDYENSGGSYIITVQASDGGLTSTQDFTIAVEDVAPSAPADTDGPSGAVVNEGLSSGAAVGITAQSADVNGGSVVYSLTDDAGGRFAIDPATGVVTVAAGQTLNQDDAASQDYSITVQARAGSLSTSQGFTVTVNNVAPLTPSDSSAAANTVSEGAADGDTVGLMLTSTDPGGATFTWSLTDDAGGRFAIDPTTGVVTVADASLIDYESSGGSYTIVAQVSDGSLTSSQSFTIAVTNVAPVSDDDSYTIDEDQTLTVAAPGTLGNDDDVNGGTLTAALVSGPQHAASFTLNPDGSFSYKAAADYNGGDSFIYMASDGSTTGTPVTVSITVSAVNDAPEVSGVAVFTAIGEDSGERLITQAELLGIASDIDSATLEARNLAILTGAGSLIDNHDGTWTYTPALNDDTSVTFSYQVSDGVAGPMAAAATLDITPVNDAPAGAGGPPSAGAIAPEQVATVIDAAIVVTDPDNATLPSGTVTISGNYHADQDVLAFLNTDAATFGNIAAVYAAGVLSLTSAGGTATLAQWQAALRAVTYTNTSDTPHTADRTITFELSDGSASSVIATDTVGIVAVNDAPVNTLPAAQTMEANHSLAIAGLSIGDVDAASGTMTTTLSVAHGAVSIGAAGGAIVTGSGSNSVSLTGTLAQINAALSAVGNVVYTPTHDFFGYDTLTFATNDGGSTGTGGAWTDIDTLSIAVSPPEAGTTGNDSYKAQGGNERIDAGGGIDTITFNFKLTDATVTYVGNTVVIDGPGTHTVLSGFERFSFTDGIVDNRDSDPLVDDLFYYSTNHDVWNAHIDADQHYHSTGWKAGLDPNAFFSTNFYLWTNPAVKASGADPLIQFDQSGWKAGAVPSLSFDPAAYLAANPDVKAAGVDPLVHFLRFGYEETRQPIAPSAVIAPNGFDYVYYLNHNPDVAAAGIDPLLHFQTVGWKEGRNPNAFFDTNGYLDAYADVKAAGVNPFDHYNQFGWHEGRDPSVAFDTTSYLAAYADVNAAHVNPLTHFLQFGIHEGRSGFADGVWG